MNASLSRRQWLGGIAGTVILGTASASAEQQRNNDPFIYSLNTSTIRGQKIPIDQEVGIAADKWSWRNERKMGCGWT